MLDASRTAAPVEAAPYVGPGIVFEHFEPMRVMAAGTNLTTARGQAVEPRRLAYAREY
jgi:hypothetical protein